MNSQTKVTKETKNKIRADFERAPLAERLKAKYLNSFFYKKLLSYVFRFLLLLGISYVILYPFASKILQSVFSPVDLIQTDVLLVSKYPTLDTYKAILTELGYIKKGIDGIEQRLEKQETQYIDVIKHLTAVEESAKQAHKRIDKLEKYHTPN